MKRRALLIIDVQPSFNPPDWQVEQISALVSEIPSVATVERHNESVTPFWEQLRWKPQSDDDPLVATDKVFVKHGYLPPLAMIGYFKNKGIEQVLVCGIQADTCCLAAGFMLFDAGLYPTLLKWLTIGSSLDRSGTLGAELWRHHFGAWSVLDSPEDLSSIV